MMMTALALLLTAQPVEVAADGNTIVVTARSLADTEASLRACLARRCPPEQDIAATTAHAENLFVAGLYDGAFTTLRQSIGRNSRYAGRLPVAVSGLYLAHSRLAAHLGHGDQLRSSSYNIVRSLKAGLPDDDPRVVGARFEVAAMQLSLGKPRLARNTYQEIAGQADRIGRGDLAKLARLRVAWIDYLDGDRDGGRVTLRKLSTDPAPDAKISRIAALVLLSRIDRSEGRKSDTDALIAELKQARLDSPVLLYAPPVELRRSPIREEGEAGNTLRLMAMDTFEKKWIDVGFWVEADGRVRDVELLRHSGETNWAKGLLASVKGRIYAPLRDTGGSYSVERHSYSSLWETRTGSRIGQRSANARIESLDLSTE